VLYVELQERMSTLLNVSVRWMDVKDQARLDQTSLKGSKLCSFGSYVELNPRENAFSYCLHIVCVKR
jgi:hypothetical protein